VGPIDPLDEALQTDDMPMTSSPIAFRCWFANTQRQSISKWQFQFSATASRLYNCIRQARAD
jgi:hypothetical protein